MNRQGPDPDPAPRAQPTMADVAKLAGVSLMTVSRVVNGTGHVRAATRSKVAAAMARLLYSPNQEARNLAGSRPMRVGFLYSSACGGDPSGFLVGLLGQSGLDNVQLLVEKCQAREQEAEHLGRLLDCAPDGIILAPLSDNEGAIARIVQAGIPAVAIACGQPDERVGTIGIDDHEAAYRMTRHLAALGHRRIGFVAGLPDQAANTRRLAGYRAAIAECGGDQDDRLVAPGAFTYRSGLDAAEYLLGLDRRPTAIFASNDDMAAAVVAVAHCRGLDVPGDLTVTGFGDSALATTIWPELTTVRQPNADMARAAVQSLVRRVRALRREGKAGPEHVRVEFELVRRQSDAVPRVRPQAWQPGMRETAIAP